jgi:hypothetical protein
MGRSEDGRKGSTNTETEKLETNQDQGVETHEQRKEREEGKEAEGSEEGEGLQEEGV